MTNELSEDAIRALLRASSCLRQLTLHGETGAAKTGGFTKTTTALTNLLEGWCVDYAARMEHPAFAGVDRQEASDPEMLDLLRRHYSNHRD